jgi:hypothetical protein
VTYTKASFSDVDVSTDDDSDVDDKAVANEVDMAMPHG